MLRNIKTFSVDDIPEFKKQLLSWSQQFETAVWLDSNNYKQQYSNFDCALAADEFTSIKTDYYNALASYGSYTCFVPENDAIDAYLQSEWGVSSLEEMISEEQIEALKEIVRFHTLNAKKAASSFTEGILVDSTFSGDRLTTSYTDGGGKDSVLINKVANLTAYDIDCDNETRTIIKTDI